MIKQIRNNDNYNVKGFFYQFNGQPYRKQLDIKLKKSLKKMPDLMVIMMNPGSSKQERGYENEFNKLVPTVADDTQKHIIHLLEHWGLQYARILNLSDFRHPGSPVFYYSLKHGTDSFPEHTIFHTNRSNELNKLFVQGTPVIIAWGVQTCLKELANLALSFLNNHPNLIGLNHPKRSYSYYHPMRHFGKKKYHKISWRDEMKTKYKQI